MDDSWRDDDPADDDAWSAFAAGERRPPRRSSPPRDGDQGDGADPRRTHRLLLLFLLPVVAATVVGLVLLWPRGPLPSLAAGVGSSEVLDATILANRVGPCVGTDPADAVLCQQVTASVTSGSQQGRSAVFEVPQGTAVPEREPGGRVVLGFTAEAPEGQQYAVQDFQRDTELIVLAALFVVVLVAFGRWRGLRALAGLAVSMAVILGFVLPAILSGRSPVLVALVGSSAVALVALYVAHGLRLQTTVALLGTLGSLTAVGLLAWVFVGATRLTGFASEEASLLQASSADLNIQGLVLAGMVLGALGVLDDVTVTQAAAVWQLRRANPDLGVGALYRGGREVGQAHIASTVNTLVLAYAGASLPLLLILRQADRSLGTILTGELLATEIVRARVGSIGLVLSVPMTTLLAAVVAARLPRAVFADGDGHTH